MTVTELLEMATDLSHCHVTVYDLGTETNVIDSEKLAEDEDITSEIYFSGIGDYEVCSYDLFLHDGIIHLEINIEYDFEEEE